jgi:YebC/PmpR family DNA-binding regulatory protein
MSGHSKWSTIKRQKGAADAQRGQLFTKLSKEIILAAKQGGADPDSNFRLRLAVQKAREANMPADNIKRAIAKASGGGEGADVEEITYEGYGPAGAALIVEVATDNRMRTVAEVRNVFARSGGNMGEAGSVAWNFELRGLINVPANGKDPDEIAMSAIDAGAEDFAISDGAVEIYTQPGDLEGVRKALEGNGIAVESAEVARLPKTTVALEQKDAVSMLKLVEKLEGLDDVQKVYFNAEITDEALAAYAG